MALLIGFLTFILVVNCLFLILLVLVQLPKKEAGAGVAFGGGATDALFGAGSGNALTKLTKYSAGIFIALALVLTILNAQRRGASSKTIEQRLSSKASAPAVLPTAPPKPTNTTGLMPLTTATNLPALTPPPSTGAISPAPAATLQLTPEVATPPAVTAPAKNPSTPAQTPAQGKAPVATPPAQNNPPK
jgi:protein translocase SecG subunit